MSKTDESALVAKIEKLTNEILNDEVTGDNISPCLEDSLKKKIFWLLNTMGMKSISFDFTIASDDEQGDLDEFHLNTAVFQEGDNESNNLNNRFSEKVSEALIELCLSPLRLLANCRSMSSNGTITYDPVKMCISVDENIDNNVQEEFDQVVWSKKEDEN